MCKWSGVGGSDTGCAVCVGLSEYLRARVYVCVCVRAGVCGGGGGAEAGNTC
jgi:hypothetical protein